MSSHLLPLSTVIVIVTVWFVSWISKQKTPWVQKVLDWFPAILFAYVIPAAITHLFKIDLSKVALHDLSKAWIIPFAIVTVMSALSFRQLRIIGFRPIIVFVIGSAVIATLPVILVFIFGWFDEKNLELFMDQAYWKGLVPIVGGWIGGSTSQLVLKELAATPEGLFLSILVLDNILVNIWTILMFQFIKRSDQLNQYWKISASFPLVKPPEISKNVGIQKINLITIGSIVLVMVITYILNLGFLITIVFLSVVGLALGNLMKLWNHKLVLELAGYSIVLIMAILGLKLNFDNLSLPLNLIALVIIWLLLHFLFMLLSAVILRVNIAWVAIGSMANLGGISTAPAVTSAYKKELMPHAVILAILSMVSGTAWGMLTIFLFKIMQ